eukprot:6287116-Prymnesium_polylepis.2
MGSVCDAHCGAAEPANNWWCVLRSLSPRTCAERVSLATDSNATPDAGSSKSILASAAWHERADSRAPEALRSATSAAQSQAYLKTEPQ